MKNFPVSILSAATIAFAGQSNAATITLVSASAYSAGVTNLTTTGSSDWAYWSPFSGGSVDASAPTNQKSGASLISTLFAVDGGTVRGTNSGAITNADFSFTDGTSPTSSSVSNVIGAFNSQLNNAGAGIGLTITLPTVETYRITIWSAFFGNNDVSGDLTASLTGATTYTNTTLQKDNGLDTKDTYVFTFDVTPDTANDQITISNTLVGTGTNANAHALISGVAIGVIPEPSSLALLSLGGLLAFRRRR